MNSYTRKDFLKTIAALSGITIAGTSFNSKNYPLLSFSTLGCPDWTLEKILDFAIENSYQGVEIRGIQRQLDLTKCTEFNSNEKISATRKLVEQKGLRIVDLASSAALHYINITERTKNLDNAKRFIDLADKLGCPFIRVFPNNLPKEQDRNETIDAIISGLLHLGDYAKGSDVTVLLESHGDLVYINDLKKIMQSAGHKNVGIIWDVINMWAVTKEPPAQAYEQLKKYIRHTHIKDMKLVNGKEQYTLLAKGEAPVFEAIDILRRENYKGYYSFEWEKLWHPEIEEPEVALADYARKMRKHFEK